MFLAIVSREVKVSDAVRAVEEVRDEDDNVIVEAVAAQPAKFEKQVSRVSIEDSAESVAENMNAGKDVKYYKINATPTSCTLKPVTLKANRKPAPVREVIEIEAGGKVVGSLEVDAA